MYIDGSDPTIDDCEITDCALHSIYIKGSTAKPTVKFCHVHDADCYTLFVYDDADPDVFENKFYSAGGAAAVNIYSADGLFCGNEFRTSNSCCAVVVNGASSNPAFNEDEEQGNLWNMNHIAASMAVNIVAGMPEFGDSPQHTGANDFLNIGVNEYYIYNSSGNTILAESNYWGASQPDAAWFYGSVDRNPYESSSQSAGPSWKMSPSTYRDALIAYDNGNYEEAMHLFETIFDSEPEHERIAKIAFLYAKSALKLGRLDKKLQFLDTFSKSHFNEEIEHVCRIWKAYYYASIGDMQTCRTVSFSAPAGSNSERELLLSLIG